jgi:hypothetical protein
MKIDLPWSGLVDGSKGASTPARREGAAITSWIVWRTGCGADPSGTP